MKHNDILRHIMKETDITQTRLAELMGYTGQSVISAQLSRKDIYTNTLVKMLDVMGYEVVVQEKGSRQPGQILLGREDIKGDEA